MKKPKYDEYLHSHYWKRIEWYRNEIWKVTLQMFSFLLGIMYLFLNNSIINLKLEEKDYFLFYIVFILVLIINIIVISSEYIWRLSTRVNKLNTELSDLEKGLDVIVDYTLFTALPLHFRKLFIVSNLFYLMIIITIICNEQIIKLKYDDYFKWGLGSLMTLAVLQSIVVSIESYFKITRKFYYKCKFEIQKVTILNCITNNFVCNVNKERNEVLVLDYFIGFHKDSINRFISKENCTFIKTMDELEMIQIRNIIENQLPYNSVTNASLDFINGKIEDINNNYILVKNEKLFNFIKDELILKDKVKKIEGIKWYKKLFILVKVIFTPLNESLKLLYKCLIPYILFKKELD